MALPKQVEEAARRSEELAKQLAGTEKTEEVIVEEEEELEAGEHSETEETELEAAEENDEQLSTEEAEEEDDDFKPQEIDWQHKYAVLQGKYNKEIPQLQNQVKYLMGELEKSKETKEDAPAPQIAPTINPKDYEEYGEEFVKLANIINNLTSENESLKGQLTSVSNTQTNIQENQQQSSVKAFYAELNRLCPAWEKINVDPNFLSWLAQSADQFGQKTRQDYLDDATQQGDAVGVATIFNSFKDKYYSSKRPVNKPTLEEQAPPKTQSAEVRTGKTNKQAKVWTGDDIKKFYSDKAMGKYKHNPDVAKKLEADLFKAQQEGRIVR